MSVKVKDIMGVMEAIAPKKSVRKAGTIGITKQTNKLPVIWNTITPVLVLTRKDA